MLMAHTYLYNSTLFTWLYLFNVLKINIKIGVATKKIFFIYLEVDDEHMKNLSTSKVLSIGNVILNITFGKLLNLNNMLHIANIRNNLVSAYYWTKIVSNDLWKW
jgi:hypothetical protein